MRPPSPSTRRLPLATTIMVLLEALLVAATVAAKLNYAITGNELWVRRINDVARIDDDRVEEGPKNEASIGAFTIREGERRSGATSFSVVFDI